MDDFANRQTDGKPGAAFLFDHLSARTFGLIEDFLGGVRVETGPLLERQTVDGGARPDRDHAVAVLAENEGVDLRRRRLQAFGEIAAKARRVEHGAQADDALPGEAEPFDRE